MNLLTAPKYGYGYGTKAKEQGFKLKESDLALLGQDVDVASMAPSTLVLELRRRKREAKRVNRSEARRSNLRASTLATGAATAAATATATDPDAAQGDGDAEEDDGKNKGRRGRVAQHIAATRTIRKPLTQSQLIEAALEEEERNKEALRDWLKKEEEKRELRRVGRKVVKGPRWTWVSRTVGRLVEEVPEPAEAEKQQQQPSVTTETQIQPLPPAQSETNAPYTRNYIILSQIPGGLPAELQIVLGSHVEWDKLKVIPSRNRPISAFSFFPSFKGVYVNKGVYDLSLTDFKKQTDKYRSARLPTYPPNTDILPPSSHSPPKTDTKQLKRSCRTGTNG